MKRYIYLAAVVALGVGLVGCKSGDQPVDDKAPVTSGNKEGEGKPGAPAPNAAPMPTPGGTADAPVGTKAGG